MALTDFDVTPDDVLAHVPFVAGSISATSEPVSTGDIEAYVQDAQSELAGVLRKAGLDATSIDADAERQMQAAVKAYAVAEVMDALGARGRDYDKYREKWKEMRARYDGQSANVATPQRGVKSNVDTSDCKQPSTFIGTGYQH